MSVQEKIPYVSYIANGSTVKFNIPFDLHDAGYLVVTVDKMIPAVGGYIVNLNDMSITFVTAPRSGAQVELYRDTKLKRDTNYQSYDNSFRPSSVNFDFDSIWQALQDQHMVDARIAARIREEIEQRRVADGLMQGQIEILNQVILSVFNDASSEYVANKLTELNSIIQTAAAAGAGANGWTASLVVSANGETQQEINDYNGAKWRNKIGGYRLNARVMLDNGDIVKSTVANNTVNPNVSMVGWIFDSELLLEIFGAKEGAENSDAIQAAFDYLRSIGGGSVSTNIKEMSISKQCVYHDNTTVDFNNCKVTLTNAGQICSALYNADRSAFTGFSGAEIYYKYQASRSINNPNSRISSDVNAKSSSLLVSSATGFAVGDYVLVSNGYCDMWRVMEKYDSQGLPVSRSFQDWVKPEVDLWRCEIARIKSISGNTIVFEDELENEYKATTKTYGFFSDENNREDHQGWNYPFIERLGGASNCTFKNLRVNNMGSASVALVGYCGINNNALDCEFEGNGQGVDFITCFNSHILRSYSETKIFGQSIRRGAYMCIMANASAKYVSGDCPLIIWEGAQHCIANNIQVDGTGGNINHAKIGFYFNTCWNCIGSNFTGKNLDSVVGVLFCRGNIIVNNMNGVNCGVLFGAYATFDTKAEIGTLKGDYLDAPSIYDSSLFNVAESNNIEVSKLRSFEKYSATKDTGRAHIYKSFAVDLKDIDAPNVILWNSVDDDKKYESSKFKMKTKDCVFKLAYLTQTYDNGEAQTRRTYFRDTEIKQRLEIVCTHNTELKGVDIKGLDSNIGLTLTISHYTRLIGCNITNETAGIDFRGSGPAWSEGQTSLVYMRNTSVNAPIRFLNYSDPSYLFSINNPSPKGKGIQYVSVLSGYPKLRTFANPAGDGNTVGWVLVEDSRQVNIESYSSADLQVASGYINTIGNKWLGREVYNTTIGKFMKATGYSSTSSWVSTDGLTTITPV